ncbi:hypothetical protein JXL83_01820 [candidate division WOR-3 bacterium]|nr:hypothetical protein [candidate division WOR-3 bacterium]
MRKSILLIALPAAVFLLSCSKSTRDGADTTAVSDTSAAVVPDEPMNPKELGEEIGSVYLKALEDVTDLIKDKPDAEEIRPAVEELKEANIQILVELGKLREAMNPSDRGLVDIAIMGKLDSLSKVEWYTTYTTVISEYASTNRDFYDLLSSFNIIGQYANFDLLKNQEPEEAKRLGIE